MDNIVDTSRLEKKSLEIIIKYYDREYSTLNHNGTKDDFDFTNNDRTWGVEQTAYISPIDEEVIQYEKALEQGKCPDSKRILDANVDTNGGLLGYAGEGVISTINSLEKRIINKNKKCKRRITKEPSFKRIELLIYVKDNPLFRNYNSIKPLDSFIKAFDSVFTRIFVVFYNCMYIFNRESDDYEYLEIKI